LLRWSPTLFFSLDADLLAAWLLRGLGVSFEEHSGVCVQMPIVMCDMKLMKPTPTEMIPVLRERADVRLGDCAKRLLSGEAVHDGRPWMRPLAFLRQRMFYQGRIRRDFAGFRVSGDCTGCGSCVRRCPTGNLSLTDGRVKQAGRCTQCYRCANLCPNLAITLWGTSAQWQYKGLGS
jgi:ferredoxin